MMVCHGPSASSPRRNRRPSAFPPGQSRSAMLRFTMATAELVRTSVTVNARPCSNATPSVSKYRAVTPPYRTLGASSAGAVSSAMATVRTPPPRSGMRSDAATDSTLASASSRATTSSTRRALASAVRCESPRRSKRIVSNGAVSIPPSARRRFTKLRVNSSAPTSSTIERATSATTRELRNRFSLRLSVAPQPLPRTAAPTPLRTARTAGARPETKLASTAVPAAKSSTRPSMGNENPMASPVA